MPFPNVERVIYKKNPLVQVVCQLRFPRILMINEKQPMEFQERIRDQYPLFQVAIERQQQIVEAREAIPMYGILQSEAVNNYKFSSADGKWHINLTSTFLALSTQCYDTWENFTDHLKNPLSALLEIYRPPFYERVGLRYVDAFKRSALNLGGVNWVELIQPFVLGFMSNPDISSDVKEQKASVELDIGNMAVAQINAVKGFVGDANIGFLVDGREESFIVDTDMFMLRTDLKGLDNSLAYLHEFSTKLIRSIITDKLHKAMEPSKL